MQRLRAIICILPCFLLWTHAQEPDPLTGILESLEIEGDTIGRTTEIIDTVHLDTGISVVDTSQVPVTVDTIPVPHVVDTVQAPDDTLDLIPDTLLIFPDTSYFIPGDDGYSLILAADDGDLAAVDLLVSRGTDLDAATEEGVTPLMYAAHNGFPEVVEYLIGHGADVNAVPENGITALISASKTGDYEICKMLVDSGADIDVRDYNGLSALLYASAYNHPAVIALCIENGAAINQRDWMGNNPLLMAACFGNYEAVDLLLDYGAYIDSRDYNDFTALHIACQNGDYDLVWLLIDKGADVNALNKGMLSPLAIAVDNSHQDIVELLLESGANINQKLSSSRTTLDIAHENKDEQMEEYLLRNGARSNPYLVISDILLTTELDFSGNDFLLGQAGGVREKKTGINLQVGYMFRPMRTRILDIEHELYATQYWERRHLIFLALDRNLRIWQKDENQYGFLPGVRVVHSWSNYRGSDLHPEPLVALVPSGSIFWRSEFFQMNLTYEYLDYRMHNFSPHRFNMAFRFYINRTKDEYQTKQIPWF